MADNGNHGGRALWPSLEVASRISDLANVAFIASLVVGVVSTSVIVWMAGVKEEHWDRLREQSRENVAALEVVAAEANKQAAEAKERTALAETKLENIRQEFRGREFDKIKFLGRLTSVQKRPVKILHAADDPDAFSLANFEIGMQLIGSGWQVYGLNEVITPEIGQCAPFGDVAVAIQKISQEELADFSNPPAQRTSTPWAMADALHQGIKGSRGVGVTTCPFVSDSFLYILVGRKSVFLP